MGMIRRAVLSAVCVSALAGVRAADADRTFADFPLAAPTGQVAAVSVAFSEPAPPEAVRAVTLHLRSGGGWLFAQVPAARARGTLRVPLAAFVSDGAAGPASSADAVRVSFWRFSPEVDVPPVAVSSAAFSPPASVAIAGAGLGAERCGRILDRLGVPFDLLPGTGFSDADLAAARVLLLPDAASLAPRDMTAVRAFVRRGGRPVVFYSADPRLSDALGMRPGSWEGGSWTGLEVSSSGRRIPHPTENRICPRPGPNARVLAVWVDSLGRATAAPAAVLAPRGAWFAHIPPRAYPAACALFRTVLSSLAEGVVEPRGADAAAGLLADLPPDLPLAAWANATEGNVPPALRALFVRVAAGAPLPESSGANAPAMHAWLPCLLGDGGAWLDPADPAVRRAAAEEAARLVRAGAAGVNLDYVRTAAGVPVTPERAAAVTDLVRDVSAAVRAANPKAVVSAAVFPTPAEAASVNQDWPAWVKGGFVDFVTPMIYTDDPATFRAKLGACLSAAPAAALVPGIGTGADESQTDRAATAAQLSACAAAGCRGAAFFALDDALRDLLR